MFKSILRRFASAAVIIAAASPTIAFAGEVEIASYDGSWQIMAEFISYDDTLFTIGTDLGEMTVSAKSVICQDVACPSPQVIWSDVREPVKRSEASNALILRLSESL